MNTEERQEWRARDEFDKRYPIRTTVDTLLRRVKPYWVDGYVEGCKRMVDLLEFISHKQHPSSDFSNFYYVQKFIEKFEEQWDEFYKQELLNKPR